MLVFLNTNLDRFRKHNIPARTVKHEPRGKDGRGFSGPGLDHGNFDGVVWSSL